MANAPLVGQDGGSPTADLPDENSGIFFRRRLDRWNRLESAQEFRANAHDVLDVQPRGEQRDTR
jgi:hypothetical protein